MGKLTGTFAGIAALFMLGLAAGSANAATYNWIVSCSLGTACDGNGSLVTDGNIGNDPVLSMTGTLGGQPITALLSVGSFLANDNLITSLNSPWLSNHGISFKTDFSDHNIRHSNVPYDLGGGVYLPAGFLFTRGQDANCNPCAATFSLTLVPEVPIPAALPLFAAGLSAMGFMGWRRKRNALAS